MTNEIQKAIDNLTGLIGLELIDQITENHLRLAVTALERQEKETCSYIQIEDDANIWECSECGGKWILNAGSPSENNMNYCQQCGRKLEEAK